MPRIIGIRCGVNTSSDSAIDGLQYLAYFGLVPVPLDRVSLDRFGHFAKRGADAGLAARATGAGLAIGDNRGRVDALLREQRQQGQDHRGRVTAGIGHDAAHRVCAARFSSGKPVNGLGHQLRTGVGSAIPLLPGGNILYTEIRGQVDDAARRPRAGLSACVHGRGVRRSKKHQVAIAIALQSTAR